MKCPKTRTTTFSCTGVVPALELLPGAVSSADLPEVFLGPKNFPKKFFFFLKGKLDLERTEKHHETPKNAHDNNFVRGCRKSARTFAQSRFEHRPAWSVFKT